MKQFTALCLSMLTGVACAVTVSADLISTRSGAVEKAAGQSKELQTKRSFAGRRLHHRTQPSGLTMSSHALKPMSDRNNMRAPKAIQDLNVYGALCYYDDDELDKLGICSINTTDGSYDNIVPFDYIVTGAGISDGKIYVAGDESTWTTVTSYFFKTYDLSTGAELDSYSLSLPEQEDCVMLAACFDANEKAFYGLTVNDDYDAVLTKFDITTHQFTHLGVTEAANSMTINQDTGEIVGVFQDEDEVNYLNFYDRLDGSVYRQVKINYPSDFAGGICWNSAMQAYLWNPNSYDWSRLMAITPEGVVTQICELADYAEFTALISPESKTQEAESPAPAKFAGFDFAGASLSGNVYVALPLSTASGNTLSGTLDYHLYCDREEVSSGKGNAGSTVKIPVTTTEGLHSFSITVANGEHQSAPVFENYYVGNDTPAAPQGVTLTASEVTWQPVEEGVHGGYVDLSRLTYTVKLNGEVIASDISGTSCPTGLSASEELAEYVAEVTASANGMTSAPGRSDALKFGEPFSLPVYLAPTDAESGLFTIIDSNGDGAGWKFIEGNPNRFRYGVSDQAADDWLILPPVKVESPGEFHKFTMSAFAWSEYLHERVEVKIGKAPEAAAMTETVLEATLLENIMPETLEGFFRVDEPGVYYIGVHAISDANRYYMYCYDFNLIATGIRGEGPAYPTDVNVVAGEKGALFANVSATLPTKTIDGDPIPATDKILFTVTTEAGRFTTEGTPGQKVELKVNTVQGMNEIGIQCSLGETLGEAKVVNIFTGMDVPAAITNVKVEYSEDNYGVKISWDAPVEGGHGGYIDRDGIIYSLCQQSPFGWVQGAELGTDVFEYNYSVPVGTPQEVMMIGIVAENKYGLAPIFTPISIAPGELYYTPAKETFSDGADYGPVAVDKLSGYSAWDIDDPLKLFGIEAPSSEGYALLGASSGSAEAIITFPKFKASGMNDLTLGFTMYCGKADDVVINASGYGVEEKEVFRLSKLNPSVGFNHFMIHLPAELQNIPWVTFSMNVQLAAEEGMFILDSYTLRNRVADDLGISELRAPGSVAVGQNANVSIIVENAGTKDATYTGGTFNVVNESGKVVYSQSVKADKPLTPSELFVQELTFAVTPDMIGDSSLEFELATRDEDNTNNYTSVSLNVKKGDAVFVDDLSGKWVEDMNHVELSWSKAEYEPGFESFEDEVPFEISSDKIGDFINIDRDGKELYFWEGCGDLPYLSNIAYKPGAFNVISVSELNRILGSSVTAPDGDQVLMAFCPERNPETGEVYPADDWLISPECVPGTSFSFDILPLSPQYGAEILEICYSTGSTNPDDFQTLETIAIYLGGWEHREFTLPDDATRFAIHYISEDIFGVMIDALSFNPANVASVKKYEVYRFTDGDPALLGETSECSYVDSNVESTLTYNYYVVPVLSDGARGVKSNVVTVGASGVDKISDGYKITVNKNELLIEGFEGEQIVLTDAAGLTYFNGRATAALRLHLPSGIYLLHTPTLTRKLIIR